MNKRHKHHRGIHIGSKRIGHYVTKHISPTVTKATAITKPLAQSMLQTGLFIDAVSMGNPLGEAVGGTLTAAGGVGVGISTVLNQGVKAAAKADKGEDYQKHIEKGQNLGTALYKNNKDDIYSLFI